MTHELKERGLIAFLRDYLVREGTTQTPCLRKLLLGFGIVPVGQISLYNRTLPFTFPA